jgi:hypothetical protein
MKKSRKRGSTTLEKIVLAVAVIMTVGMGSTFAFQKIDEAKAVSIDADGRLTEGAGSAGEAEAETEGLQYESISDAECRVIRYAGTAKAVTIPSVAQTGACKGKTVTEIDDEALNGKDFESLSLPDTLRKIGLICNNPSLKMIIIPDTVAEMPECALSGNDSLTYARLPKAMASIPDDAFERCPALKTVIIPEGVEAIGTGAFEECNSLPSITLPSTLKSIGDNAFDYTSIVSVTIPASVSSLGFSDLDAIESINVDPSNACFSSSDGILFNKPMTKLISRPKAMKSSTFKVPSSVIEIGCGAFAFAKTDLSVVIPESVKTIGSNAFYMAEKTTIYCEAASKPAGWDAEWNVLFNKTYCTTYWKSDTSKTGCWHYVGDVPTAWQ